MLWALAQELTAQPGANGAQVFLAGMLILPLHLVLGRLLLGLAAAVLICLWKRFR